MSEKPQEFVQEFNETLAKLVSLVSEGVLEPNIESRISRVTITVQRTSVFAGVTVNHPRTLKFNTEDFDQAESSTHDWIKDAISAGVMAIEGDYYE